MENKLSPGVKALGEAYITIPEQEILIVGTKTGPMYMLKSEWDTMVGFKLEDGQWKESSNPLSALDLVEIAVNKGQLLISQVVDILKLDTATEQINKLEEILKDGK